VASRFVEDRNPSVSAGPRHRWLVRHRSGRGQANLGTRSISGAKLTRAVRSLAFGLAWRPEAVAFVAQLGVRSFRQELLSCSLKTVGQVLISTRRRKTQASACLASKIGKCLHRSPFDASAVAKKMPKIFGLFVPNRGNGIPLFDCSAVAVQRKDHPLSGGTAACDPVPPPGARRRVGFMRARWATLNNGLYFIPAGLGAKQNWYKKSSYFPFSEYNLINVNPPFQRGTS
jgi:hypothetical protein